MGRGDDEKVGIIEPIPVVLEKGAQFSQGLAFQQGLFIGRCLQ